MRLEQPLWLLLALPALAAFLLSLSVMERRRAALVYPEAADLRVTSKAKQALVRSLSPFIRALALLLIVIALARPQAVSPCARFEP